DWPRMGRRDGLLRVGLVVATAAILTAITLFCAPPIALRVGEISARDVRARVAFGTVNVPQTERLREEFQDQGKTSPVAAREAVPPVVEEYPAGAPLVKRGQPITPLQLTLLHEEQRAYDRSLGYADVLRVVAAEFVIHLLICGLVALYV